MKELVVSGLKISPAIYIPVLYFLWVTVFLVLKKLIFGNIKKFSDRSRNKVDDTIIYALDLPLVLLIFSSGVFFLDNIFEFGKQSELLAFVDITFKATTIIAIVLFLDRLFKGIIQNYSQKFDILKGTSGMLRVVVRLVVIGLGVLILMDSFGVSITPLLASLGVGSLAIALALQPTLENFFSGIQLMIDRPIKIGQFIKLESGEEGYVHRIGWRSTWVRMLPNNTVVIPNKALVSSKVLNYYYPETEISIYVDAGVHYDSDLEQVEKVTLEVAREVLESVEGGVPGFEPFLRYHTFNDSSIDFKVILRAKEFVAGYLVKHEFIKRLQKRYKEEGIVIPYPIRTLDWNEGSGPLKVSKKD